MYPTHDSMSSLFSQRVLNIRSIEFGCVAKIAFHCVRDDVTISAFIIHNTRKTHLLESAQDLSRIENNGTKVLLTKACIRITWNVADRET